MAAKKNKKKPETKATKRKKLLPDLKKGVEVFLTSEEGKVVKQDVVKTAVALGIIGTALLKSAHDLPAQPHNNYLHNSGGTGMHASHASHGSHGSHGSHE